MSKPTRTRPMTNTEFLAQVMDRARTGPIMHLVVITAIDNYTRRVASLSVEELEKQLGPLIGAESWKAAAEEMQAALEERTRPTDNRYRVTEAEDEDDDVLYVRLDADNLTALREAAMGAITAIKGAGFPARATLAALNDGLLRTSGAHVDELVGY